jgi:hypothetical protein
MEKFKDVLEGKIKKDDLTPEELIGYKTYVSDLSKEEEAKVTGLRGARQAEEKKLADLKAEAERLTNGGSGDTPPEHPQMKQFRIEQVLKAKNRLWATIKASDAEKTIIEDKFSRLDSGKVDSDLIYEDLLSAVAASNPKKFIELSGDDERRKREAEDEIARQAGGAGGSGGSGNEPKKFSDEVLNLSKDAGISPEAAQRQVSQGNKRTYSI